MAGTVRMAAEDKKLEPWALQAVADAALEHTASQLYDIVRDLAGRLCPFPTFANTTSIQAIEVVPKGLASTSRGCVVVCPDGELYELSLSMIPGALGVSDADQVEEYTFLELPPEEYIPYAYTAIQALTLGLGGA